MLKTLYLKETIFFLSMLFYNFYGYGMDNKEDYSDENLLHILKEMRRNGYNNRYNDVKAETPFWNVIKFGIKQGAAQASLKEALRVISRLLEIIPYSVNKFISMIKIYAYKGAFGTTGLTARDLTKFSNRIQGLCSPLASSQVSNLRKTKRAAAIESEQDNGQCVDMVWLKRRSLLVSELEHIITFLKNVLPCYSPAFQSIDASIIEKQLAAILYALSTENNNEIQNYIIRLIGYIKELINLLESFNSFDNAVEHADETKTMLTIVRTTFEHIATFLADSTIKGAGNFQKFSDDMGGNKRDLMDILGSGGLK